MTKELLTPDYIFEASWEVCNKVGGIYTVLSTRANTLQTKFRDRLFFIGPDFWQGKENPLFIESDNLCAAWKKHAALKDNLSVRVGRWNIPGEPIVILVDFQPFFAQKNEQLVSTRQVEQENLENKRGIIAKLKEIDESMDSTEAVKIVRDLMAQWNSIGHVPFKEKDKIYKEYQSLLDTLFSRLNMNENRNRLSNFSATVQQMADTNHDKLYRERERLLRMYEQKKGELKTYENNIGFLNISSKKSGGLLKEMERKMQKIREDMQLIEQKVQLIDKNL